MKTAFLFSGQGAQYVGMGQELFQAEAVVRQTFEEASDALGYDVAKLCFEENPQLNQTEYTQPAILTVSVAFLRVLQAKKYPYVAVAGLSLGEYSALIASGALSFTDGIRLIAKRGKYMANAAPAGVGKMVAVMNTPVELIEESCQEASEVGIVSPANYNTPQQIVIGGEVAAVDRAVEILAAKGAKRMIPLNVSGPFHTALLQPAAEQLREALAEIYFSEMQVPVISNTTAKIMQPAEIKNLLEQQVMSPVRFFESIATLRELGVDTMVEIGPGKTLSGFIRKIDKSIAISRVEDLATLAETEVLLNRGT
ncbi:[acyl-carrier-protein] S-malonyltransferase [Enterococcus sp. PF1-24]|uniref:ACP S-malonyltransferase n=1 Tax=unclassified Enterococcus TaxID=2608891 RepID=UPI002476C8E2|nr:MULTISPECIES: ACP S-malonyltransferase [unclassified Enterococcus]MDH6363642.1 [acyl-carrier-protein] S-malonyltransferase [Enterococcus sp. PFB1-1]MDH6400877.1 [acyl-carrier-protein] S-malonyltransferase [Enterococcus sp. PF1-24]